MTITVDDRLGPLGVLAGTWSGSGRGIYPTIESFEYLEEVTFADPKVKPFLVYTQRTTHAADGRPLHVEAGYLRWAGAAPELVLAQPSGIAEVHAGSVELTSDGLVLDLHTVAVASTPTAKEVRSVSRHLRLTTAASGDELRYELFMAAVGEPHQLHLEAVLRRIG